MYDIENIFKEYEEYFEEIKRKTLEAYEIAKKARSKGLDPSKDVEITFARDLIDRCINLISIVEPEIKEISFDIRERIKKYEKEYGALDWRVALKISEDIAKDIYNKTGDREKAILLGLRFAEAYITLGIVSAPLEGIVRVAIKKRRDGKEYLAIYMAGPIRTAGGTSMALVALFGDYLRKIFGISEWDPTEEEIQRYIIEIFDYNRIKSLQYKPSRRELEFLFKHLPVEITGEPTEDKEVSSFKDLPRIETNRIRGGMALTIAEGLCLKAKKIYKKLKKWGKEFNLDNWFWLEEFLKIQEEEKTKGSSSNEDQAIKPNWKYLEEIAAGRAVLSLPLAKGGFRLRYGKSRVNGFECVSIHPATATLLYDFIAVGTQIRPERPGKSAGITFCNTIEPPVVRLKDGSVIKVKNVREAKKIRDKVDKILFLGDMLINYGIILNNLDKLLPPGYCEEWWVLEFEKSAMEKVDGFKVEYDFKKPRETWKIEGLDKLSKYLGISKERLEAILRYPLKKKPKLSEAIKISLKLDVPLHPKYTFFWKDISAEDVKKLIEWLKKCKIEYGRRILINGKKIRLVKRIEGPLDDTKRILEEILLVHKVEDEKIIITHPESTSLLLQLGLLEKDIKIDENMKTGLDVVQKLSIVKVRDMVGIYIGARVGKPEKAKMRKMKGRPHMLFPVGQEGGRMRNFMEALKEEKITAELPLFYCEKCKRFVLYPNCEFCGSKTVQYYQCPKCKKITKLTKCPDCNIKTNPYAKREIDPKEYLELAIKVLKISSSEVPKILKGVRGLSSLNRIPERLEKGILRAKYGLHVFRDGTIRFDSVELPIFYFRPKDLIYTSIEKLKELGYTHDIYGRPLESEDQILELKPQDVILPAGGENFAKLLLKVANFVDEELKRLYGLEPYYNAKKPEDLIGHLGVAIAPHISSGTIVRIIGFSRTQAYFAHPLLHASCKRNCFSPDTYIFLIKDGKIIFKTIKEIVEDILKRKDYGKLEENENVLIIYPKEKYSVISYDPLFNKIRLKDVKMFIKRKYDKIVEIKISGNKYIKVTDDHPITIRRDGKIIITLAKDLREGDEIPVLNYLDICLPYKKELNKDLLWLLGYYFANGKKENGKIILKIDKNKKVLDILEKIKIKYSILDDKAIFEEKEFINIEKDVREFLDKEVPLWILALEKTYLDNFVKGFIEGIGNKEFALDFETLNKLSLILSKSGINYKLDNNRIEICNENKDKSIVKWEKVKEVKIEETEYVYSLEVDGHGTDKTVLTQYNIFMHQCDGDELSFILLLDALLNFSLEFIPKKRGGKQDAPLILTLRIDPLEVDDEVYKYDVVWWYPLEFYEKASKMEPVDSVNIEILANRLGNKDQYFNWGFFHDTKSINYGNKLSAYKKFKAMQEKLIWMIKVAEKIRAVDPAVVAKVVIDGHFAKDIKGNLRKFSVQTFRCVKCNEKYRRIPLSGKCEKCGGRIILTVSEGTVKKYLGISLWLASRVNLDNYTKQSLELLSKKVEQTFASKNERQEGLHKWLNASSSGNRS